MMRGGGEVAEAGEGGEGGGGGEGGKGGEGGRHGNVGDRKRKSDDDVGLVTVSSQVELGKREELLDMTREDKRKVRGEPGGVPRAGAGERGDGGGGRTGGRRRIREATPDKVGPQ